MARQSTSPVQFEKTVRTDETIAKTSGRAGDVVLMAQLPVLRGESGAGRVAVDLLLGEMPRPLENAVQANVQAWFVPKSAHPQFTGRDEFRHSYRGEDIKSKGAADRTPPAFFDILTGPDVATAENGEILKGLGLHLGGKDINCDLFDAYSLIYNFRLAAHSSKLTRRAYATEDLAEAVDYARAFWPSGKFNAVVPDYEQALLLGALDLDVSAGQVPIKSVLYGQAFQPTHKMFPTGDSTAAPPVDGNGDYDWTGKIWGDLQGQTIGATLADIDKARELQTFAQLRTAYAGNDATGFDNDDVIIADLMQGFVVDEDAFKRPMLLDTQRVTFGLTERHATDGANLKESLTVGRASATLSMNLPMQDVGGMILVTVEVLPERIYERQEDPYIHITDVSEFPDALRDVQRTEPVDLVKNGRIDARHTQPDVLYGYEPMNWRWKRDYTRLGAQFYQADPSNPFTQQRVGIWQPNVVDPKFTDDHFLAADDFPHAVFADPLAPAFEGLVRHTMSFRGLTQFGDILAEDNSEYLLTKGEVA